jgi:hypothetical protein
MSRAIEFRKTADKMRDLAKRTSIPEARDAWLQIADHWDRLAHEAERHPGAFPSGDGA